MITNLKYSAVEELRSQMIKIAEDRGSLTHPYVIAASQRLDVLINRIQTKCFKVYRSRYSKNKRLVIRSFWTAYKFRVERLSHLHA
ncbi:aspartyl-phosphate phosphatase Spo0E family protein [Alicyclobacillus fastidiosus]|uniref:Aspartyl-phosphate phosphatase Spo0E family protein n=1 Tax=Alicyclobacillus fastidiosus TaxID=392011 RepID=A0ABY6ZNK4_9BACL|nr:aspartyl-phosphate phosphatase Spo0E family protein [Alicyclobacillus fastidiosus]WAH44558.1 aspartyl-phosphate phosphatase Spo0E family protein [Alicyclobacillus fastidiosus]